MDFFNLAFMHVIAGAGKTTTLSMLTAEFPPTSGDAILNGYSIAREPQKIRRLIGYCPQFDALFGCLTGREHILLYGSRASPIV
jgi:ATP-binding cassette, subfamily A (ABC1), member 3